MTSIAELVVGGSCEPWEAFGFLTLSSDFDKTTLSLGDLVLIVRPSFAPGMVSWTLADTSAPLGESFLDSIPTTFRDTHVPLPEVGRQGVGTIGCLGVDHVVIRTNSLDHTCAAITQTTEAPVKRVRDAGKGVQQAFHKIGSVVIEVVESPERVSGTHLWGFVINVANIDALAEHLGPDVLSTPEPATQPGRHIATARSAAGLGVPFAVMDVLPSWSR